MHFTIKEEENFLSLQEVDKLKQEVYNSKRYWRHASEMPFACEENRKKASPEIIKAVEHMLEYQYFLGDAIYVTDNRLGEINKEIQEHLKQNYSWLYDRIIEYFKKLYNTPNVKLHEELPIPGFHIFANMTDRESDRKEFQWHNDSSIEEYAPTVRNNSVYSFVILVENIKDFSHLDFKVKESTSILPYKIGSLHIWNGNVWHRIGSMKLEPNEARITFQGHLYYDEKDNFYKLYF